MKISACLAVAGLIALGACKADSKQEARADLHVLTALPLFLGNGDIKSMLAGKSGPNPLLVRLQKGRRVIPLDIADESHLKQVTRLLAIQPGLLPPAELKALDDWVRAGGKALIFVDPDLAWPHPYPLGDPRAPPPSTMLDPLFNHWGLVLEGMRGIPQSSVDAIDGRPVALVNPGRWRSEGGGCNITDNRLVATCALGKGQAILVADADMADPRLWEQSGRDNFTTIESLLLRLEAPN